jgi:flagella basal body P-ring formation protein FlgA
VVAPRDIEAGERVPAMRVFAPAAELSTDVFTATQDVVDRIAAVPIGKGQPIVPDMLEPAAE